jgi:hypothetical protein
LIKRIRWLYEDYLTVSGVLVVAVSNDCGCRGKAGAQPGAAL